MKVTEALHKNVPIIAYRAGGIPLQIVDGHGGFLIEVGDTQAVADKLFELMDQREMRDCMAAEAKSNVTDEYFSVFQIVNWLSVGCERGVSALLVDSNAHTHLLDLPRSHGRKAQCTLAQL